MNDAIVAALCALLRDHLVHNGPNGGPLPALVENLDAAMTAAVQRLQVTAWCSDFSTAPTDGREIEVFLRTGEFAHIVFAGRPTADRDLDDEWGGDDGGPAWRHSGTLAPLEWSPSSIVGWRLALAPPFAQLPVAVSHAALCVAGAGQVSQLLLSDGTAVYCAAAEHPTVANQMEALASGSGLTRAAMRRLGNPEMPSAGLPG